jgi:hypothetical protein
VYGRTLARIGAESEAAAYAPSFSTEVGSTYCEYTVRWPPAVPSAVASGGVAVSEH